jgi:hypothetical protein
VAEKDGNMERQVKFTPPVLEQLLRLEPSEPVRLTPKEKRNNLDDIVVDKEQLWIRAVYNQLIREQREQELENLKRSLRP